MDEHRKMAEEMKNETCFIFHAFSKWEPINIDLIYKGRACITRGQRKVCKRCGYIVEERI